MLSKAIRFFAPFILCLQFAVTLNAQEFIAENIAAFIVDSITLRNPLAGGFNAPQFSNVDLNDDGLLDVVVFDRIGSAIIPMIRVSDGFIFDPSFGENFPVVDNFMLMLDYNADGIEDIFSYSISPGIPGISVFKGKYTDGKIDFDLVDPPNYPYQVLEFQLSNGSFANIAVANIDIPSFEDIDGDGDIDIVTFNNNGGGHIEYYKNFTLERGGSIDDFDFVKVDDCYGGVFETGLSVEIELPEKKGDCASSLLSNTSTHAIHAGSTLLNIDHDADGDFELLLGDASLDNITLLENAGSPSNAFFNRQIFYYPDMASEAVEIQIFPGAFYLDIDGDNVRDLVSAPNNTNGSFDIDNVWFYKNTGLDNDPTFELETKSLFASEMLDLGTTASPTFADVNGDNLIDLIIGTETTFLPNAVKDARLYLFLNVGSPTNPIFELVDRNWLDFQRFNSVTFNFSPTFADLDADGDLDLYVGTEDGSIFEVINSAGPGQAMEFGQIKPNFESLDIGQFAVPTFYDADNDGILDLIIGEKNGNINFLKNIGSITEPSFSSDLESPNNTEAYGQIDTRIPGFTTGISKPTFIATENGDVLITGTRHGALQMYDVDFNPVGEFAFLDQTLGNIRVGAEVAPAFIDINSDGFYEAFIGNRRGGLSGFKTDIRVPKPLSTEQTPIEPEIKLVSNLVRDKVEIKEVSPLKMSVYSLLGQEVISATLGNELIVSYLPAGVYFILLEKEGLQITRKFVKL